MDLFLPLAFLFALAFAVDCIPTANRINELDDLSQPALTTLTTTAQRKDQVTVTVTMAPPTSISSVQRSDKPGGNIRTVLLSSSAAPTQTDNKSHSQTEDWQFVFFTADARKLTILVMAQTVVLFILLVILVVMCVVCRSMQTKMRSLKDNKSEAISSSLSQNERTTRKEVRVQNEDPIPDEAPSNSVKTTLHQNVEYDEPYAHQQTMAVQIKKLLEEGNSTANENRADNNQSSNQITPNRPPINSLVDDDDYVKPRALESIVESVQNQEETKPADETSDNEEYKVPRNSAKRAGLVSMEPSSGNNSTLKDGMGYVVMMNHPGVKEDKDHRSISQSGSGRVKPEHDKNVYDVPKTAGPRTAETFSRKSIRTKIKIFGMKG